MIINKESLSMAEALAYIKEDKNSETDIVGFINKFSKTKKETAKKLKEHLKALDLMKVKDEHIVKIIDLMPENEEALNKIFVGVSLDENEVQKIINAIKEHK
jgi:DNA-directed RNA polymerase subunit F